MRKLREEDIRVVVTPRRDVDYGWMSMSVRDPERNANHMREEAERIVNEIRRHVSDFADVRVESTPVTVCGSDPWVIDDNGNTTRWWPNCCFVDQQEYFDMHAHESDDWFDAHGMDDPDYLQEFRDAKLGNTLPEIPGFEGTRAALDALTIGTGDTTP